MEINECIKVIKALARVKSPVSVCIWGDPGSAKSASVEQMAADLGYGYYPMIASQKEPVDIAGLPYVRKEKYIDEDTGKEVEMSVTSYHPPEWFAKAATEGKLVLFLDELNRARPDVIKAAFELINERRLNNVKLKSSVIIVVACNPSDEEKRNDVNDFDHAMTDRLLHLHTVSNYTTWKNWATRKLNKESNITNIHPDIVDYLNGDQNAFTCYFGDTHKFPVEIKQTGRSWQRASYVHTVFENDPDLQRDPDRIRLETESIKGAVGPDIAQAFMNHLVTTVKPFTGEEVLEMDKKTKEGLLKLTKAEKMEDIRVDVLKATISNVIAVVEKKPDYAKSKAKNLMNFVRMFKGELSELMVILVTGIVDHEDLSAIMLDDDDIRDEFYRVSAILKTAEAQTAAAQEAAKNQKTAKKP
jgi:hypothetical protein